MARKLNYQELDALTWKLHADLHKLRNEKVEKVRAKARQDFEATPGLKKAYDLLKAASRTPSKNFRVELTFTAEKVKHVPDYHELKSMLIITQIATPDLSTLLSDLVTKISTEQGW